LGQLKEKTFSLLQRANGLLDRGETETPLSLIKDCIQIINEVADYIHKDEEEIVYKRITAIIDSRIESIKKQNTSIEQSSNPRIVVHLFPLLSFYKEGNFFNLTGLQNQATKLPLLSGGSYDYRFNYEGFLTFNTNSGNYA